MYQMKDAEPDGKHCIAFEASIWPGLSPFHTRDCGCHTGLSSSFSPGCISAIGDANQ
jgi:hypothetical protein